MEEGIALALEKYQPRAGPAFVQSIVRGLGYLDDVQEDPGVPAGKAEVAAYWERRVPEIVRSLSRYAERDQEVADEPTGNGSARSRSSRL